ncbi:MAG: ABC transporter substrate-binding protein [Candidatus Latescibacterota bacterium]|nr:ABC transporter substrate-binding protein [Candidatus Latescibacterota bacterium]
MTGPACLRSTAASLLLAALAMMGCSASDDTVTVPRNRTLIMDCSDVEACGGQIQDYNAFNPFVPGASSRTGWNFSYEPLYYYNAFVEENNLISWIAKGHEYSEDHTSVTIHTRSDVKWSDGTPWTVRDLVFTIDMLKGAAPELLWSTDIANWVKQTVVIDDSTARIDLAAANPRFLFTFFTNNFGIGIPIVPRHVWEGHDPLTFRNFNMEKGWPILNGPYRLVHSVPQQRIWDRRDDWWAATTGFHAPPEVERLIYLPFMDETKRVQNLIANNMDTSLDLRPPNIKTALDQNPNITTWTGRQTPYGYLDFWPVSLGFNNLEPPYDDPEIRWAVNYAIDRDQLVEVGWQNAGTKTLLPFPDYPSMRRYTSQIEDLVRDSDIGTFDLEKSAAILREKGWVKQGRFWSKNGERLRILVDI